MAVRVVFAGDNGPEEVGSWPRSRPASSGSRSCPKAPPWTTSHREPPTSSRLTSGLRPTPVIGNPILAHRAREVALAGTSARRWHYSRMIMSWASRSRSTKGSPLTSTATRSIVPPVNAVGGLSRVVVSDRFAGVASHEEARASDREGAQLGFDLSFADLAVPVVQRDGARRVVGFEGGPFERCGQDQVVAAGYVLGPDYALFLGADEIVDVDQAIVLHVEGVAAEAGTRRRTAHLGLRGQGYRRGHR